MDIELIANVAPKPTSFEDGAAHGVSLLRELSRLAEFSQGWQLGGVRLDDDEGHFIERARSAVGPDEKDLGSFLLVTRSAKALPEDVAEPEAYVLSMQFGEPHAVPNSVNLGMPLSTASIDLCKRIVRTLLEWDRIQHVSIVDPYYVMEDSPLDARRRGIGWAGWVPFQLSPAQVPEAVVLEPLANGTFLASALRWAVSGDVPIAEAQALDLRLNSLGVLPTIDDLLRGDWGNRSSRP